MTFFDRVEANLSFQEINDDRRIRDFESIVRDQEENRDRSLEFNLNFLSHWEECAVFRYGVQVLRDDVRSRRKRHNLATGAVNTVPSRFANHSSITSGAAYLQTELKICKI